uniref:Ribosomal protein L10 n=1 Tax=prasinophyte sp. MBIC10622 TaxID=156113 RepID=A0A650AKK1_9CHLO|nr:ribosomal protein L10 [prasinophyte sp. MBIC10622]
MHHFNGATCETKGHRPKRSFAGPIYQMIKFRDYVFSRSCHQYDALFTNILGSLFSLLYKREKARTIHLMHTTRKKYFQRDLQRLVETCPFTLVYHFNEMNTQTWASLRHALQCEIHHVTIKMVKAHQGVALHGSLFRSQMRGPTCVIGTQSEHGCAHVVNVVHKFSSMNLIGGTYHGHVVNPAVLKYSTELNDTVYTKLTTNLQGSHVFVHNLQQTYHKVQILQHSYTAMIQLLEFHVLTMREGE